MLEMIIAAISSSGFGAILGAINGFIQRLEERKNLSLRFEHEQAMAKIDAERAKAEHAMGIEAAQINNQLGIELLNAESEAAAFELSQADSKFSAIVKACVRPVVLLYLLTLTTIVGVGLYQLVDGLETLGDGVIEDLFKSCVYMVLSLTSMAVSWYFAQRPSKHFDKMLLSAFGRRF